MKITTPDMLAQAFKEARKRKGFAQQHTAELVGIKQATVSRFENHPERSHVDTLFKLLAALELELHVADRGSNSQTQQWDQEW
ncbi:helix-turn-helix domain-containing protein [Halomonas llamarensis]|uniref:Helix-turn-helix domain-containing protein n=1 Tax=Halomonas llamarensis TaxID=2945104 RepID=A0ABT0STS6_9GAMM|nr:helix-turn-helix domain-containing protein [Halomonas llamarensis]